MKRDALLACLNEKAAELGQRPVSDRQLEDWAYEDLIPGPERVTGAPGTDWDWPDDSLTRALKVLDLRGRGFRRAAGVRAQQWIEGSDISFATVRDDLVREYDRARKLLIRHVSSTHGQRLDVPSTPHRRRALIKQLGPLDPRFAAAGFDLGAAYWLAAYEMARFGRLITPLPEDTPTFVRFLAEFRCANGNHPIAGTLNAADEDGPSTLSVLRDLDQQTAAICRDWTTITLGALPLLQAIPAMPLAEAAKAAVQSTRYWPWPIFLFGMVVNLKEKLKE